MQVIVELQKVPGRTLGFSIAGGRGSTPAYEDVDQVRIPRRALLTLPHKYSCKPHMINITWVVIVRCACTCMHKICTKKVGMTMEFVTTSISLTPRPHMANFCMWPLNYVHINLLKHLSLVDIPNVQWTLANPATVEPNHGQVYKWNSRICESSCYNASLLPLPLLSFIYLHCCCKQSSYFSLFRLRMVEIMASLCDYSPPYKQLLCFVIQSGY